MVLSNNPKRVCIYFIYDKHGIVDDYVIDQVTDMRNCAQFIHCVINGTLRPEEKEKLLAVADEVYERENKGIDIGAYKAAINHIGWKKLAEYDELVLMNNTCFGPVYPFKEAFDWAGPQNIDFWALTWDQKSNWLGSESYLHANKSRTHYQSYFLVLRKPLLGARLLEEFFAEIPDDASYIMSGSYYEYAFPGYFEERGYKGAVYCNDLEDLDYPLLHNPVRLLKKYRMPLIKKRSFFHHYSDALNHSAGEATSRLLEFISEETNYDVGPIWKSLLRTASLSDIVRCAQLNRVLPRDIEVSDKEHTLSVGLVYHVYHKEFIDECISYIGNFPKDAGMLITTGSDENKAMLEDKLHEAGINAKVMIVPNRGRDASALLVNAADFVSCYDLVCVAHDMKATMVGMPGVGRSWSYKLKENVAASKAFVSNVIHLFETEKDLGIAFPSSPNHSAYAARVGTGWGGNFWNVQKLLNDFQINVKIHPHTLCVAPLGTHFWFRPKALETLFAGYNGNGWSFSNFPCEPIRMDETLIHALERSYAYFAQAAGFYPVYLYNDKYAQIEFTNLEFHKTGSAEMRTWMDALVFEAMGYRSAEETVRLSSPTGYPVEFGGAVNYGIKQSLRHLAVAVKCKVPLFWKLLKPVRMLLKWIFRMD